MLLILALPPHALSPGVALTSRRRVLTGAAAAAATTATLSVRPASAAEGPAVELVATIGELSTQARSLQFYVRENAALNRAAAAKRVAGQRQLLRRLQEAMAAAAPDLRLCAPEAADCECAADPRLMKMAAGEVDEVRRHILQLEMVLERRGSLDVLSDGAGIYQGGAVERELELICEAADRYLDLAAGRSVDLGLAARLSPTGGSSSARPAVAPVPVAPLPAAGRVLGGQLTSASRRAPPPRACAVEPPPLQAEEAAAAVPEGRLFAEDLNLIYDSRCGVCQWEVDFLRKRDTKGRLTYTDLEAADFAENSARNGYLDYATALASFHAVTADGELLKGMAVFQAAYDAVGLGWVWRVYDNPLAAKFLDVGYALFARYRTDLTRGSSLEALVAARRARKSQEGAAAEAGGACEACQEVVSG